MKNLIKIIAAAILLIMNCSKNEITNPIELKSYIKDSMEITSIQNTQTIKVSNNMGGVIIIGWSLSDSMRIYLYKTIEAASNELAETNFDSIKSILNKNGDTLEVTINHPVDLSDMRYKHCSLSIEIPYKMNCKINNANGSVFIDQLSSDVFVKESGDKVQIDRQEGSCEVSSKNDISVSMVLPDSGYCHLNTEKGDVSLSIPDSTNSKVDLRTDDGSILYTNLTFNPVNQNTNTLSGTLGTGDAEITILTRKGNIKLNGIQ